MVNKIKIFILAVVLLIPVIAIPQSQNAFNKSRLNVGGSNSSVFNNNRASNFNDYRQQLNAEYIKQTKERWNSFNSFRGMIPPDRDVIPVTPVVMADEDARKEKQDKEIVIESVVNPLNHKGHPKPIAPIGGINDSDSENLKFIYYGTELNVHIPRNRNLRMLSLTENDVANAWSVLCTKEYNILISDCLKLRSGLKLCDWAYLMMLQSLGAAMYGGNSNEAVLVMSYLYSQSGYKIRLGERNGRLEMLYASRHKVYGKPYFELDGERFYSMSDELGNMRINLAQYPQEQSLSLWVGNEPKIAYTAANVRRLSSKRYPEMSVSVSINKNVLPFYSSYPSSEVGGDFMTRWAMYAETSFSEDLKNELYPQLKQYIAGCTQLVAVERLLNWVQTAFVYEYDDKVWGDDRAFFPVETLYYPYCDCEDRSILFTRLVRDLIGLKCLLVYYPGHLATAVCFNEPVKGDYISVKGEKYVVCDPTYIGASVGHTMPDMDNATAKVIML